MAIIYLKNHENIKKYVDEFKRRRKDIDIKVNATGECVTITGGADRKGKAKRGETVPSGNK